MKTEIDADLEIEQGTVGGGVGECRSPALKHELARTRTGTLPIEGRRILDSCWDFDGFGPAGT